VHKLNVDHLISAGFTAYAKAILAESIRSQNPVNMLRTANLRVTPTGRPLEQNLEGKQYMPQGPRPRILLAEL